MSVNRRVTVPLGRRRGPITGACDARAWSVDTLRLHTTGARPQDVHCPAMRRPGMARVTIVLPQRESMEPVRAVVRLGSAVASLRGIAQRARSAHGVAIPGELSD